MLGSWSSSQPELRRGSSACWGAAASVSSSHPELQQQLVVEGQLPAPTRASAEGVGSWCWQAMPGGGPCHVLPHARRQPNAAPVGAVGAAPVGAVGAGAQCAAVHQGPQGRHWQQQQRRRRQQQADDGGFRAAQTRAGSRCRCSSSPPPPAPAPPPPGPRVQHDPSTPCDLALRPPLHPSILLSLPPPCR